MAALEHDPGKRRPVFLAMAGLAEQPEVTVGCLAQILGRCCGRSFERLGQSPFASGSPPRLDHMPNEVGTAINWLQDGFGRVQSCTQRLQEYFDLCVPGIELLR